MAAVRPVGVTIVAVIAWISGALQILGGIIQLLPGGGNFGSGLWAIIIGVITIVVSVGLFRGSNAARIIVTIVFAVNAISSFFLLFSPFTFWSALFSGLLAVVGIILLYTKPANEYFR
ncbi:DUF7144 family membrane protein [Agromyces archimandritae]|uniref:DUF7144 domain-containing protein n=1 Tax=Agromyces archimandritae TaxID=2781962 RepID=A0A975IR19_9MICO|nr:hypothetical protein [Agromyces archimandritae]QTX05631.1 hypothetical protein G127AT_05345 [Agromyces archimandritae]